MMRPLVVALGSFLCFAHGCIGDSPRPSTDSAPDTTSDLADGLDSFDTPDATSPDSQGETATPETVEAACTSASDCAAPLPACQAWQCPAGMCLAAAVDEGESCDDGSVCTGTGRCTSGVCQPGPGLTCDEAPVCHRPICRPLSGCGSELVSGGFCQAEPGVAWGTCAGTRMAPLDRCAGDGCHDEATPGSVPIPKDQIVGDWFSLMLSTSGAAPSTVAGVGSFQDGGDFVGAIRSDASSLPVSLLGQWCADVALGAAFSAGPFQVVGQVTPDGALFGGAGAGGKDVVVALRARGVVADVHGAYAAILTSLDSQGRVVTHVGTLTFAHGCLEESGVLHNASDAFEIDQGVCFSSPEVGGIVVFGATTAIGGVTGPLSLRGVIGRDGDALVLSRAKGEGSIFVGMLVAVRLGRAHDEQAARTARWVVAMQARDEDQSSYHGFAGALVIEDELVVNGVLGAEAVSGERVWQDELGRFVVALRTPSARRMLSGYLTPRRDFGFFYEVTRPETVSAITNVSETPRGASFGVIVRRDD
jgi:hypothetical protein